MKIKFVEKLIIDKFMERIFELVCTGL